MATTKVPLSIHRFPHIAPTGITVSSMIFVAYMIFLVAAMWDTLVLQ